MPEASTPQTITGRILTLTTTTTAAAGTILPASALPLRQDTLVEQGQSPPVARTVACPEPHGEATSAATQAWSANASAPGHDTQKTNLDKRTKMPTFCPPHKFPRPPVPFDNSASPQHLEQSFAFGDLRAEEVEEPRSVLIDGNCEEPSQALLFYPTNIPSPCGPLPNMDYSFPQQNSFYMSHVPYHHGFPHGPPGMSAPFSTPPHAIPSAYPPPQIQQRHHPHHPDHVTNLFQEQSPGFPLDDYGLPTPPSSHQLVEEGSLLHSPFSMPPQNMSFPLHPLEQNIPMSSTTASLTPPTATQTNLGHSTNLQPCTVLFPDTEFMAPNVLPPWIPGGYAFQHPPVPLVHPPCPAPPSDPQPSEMERYVQSQFGKLKYADLHLNIKLATLPDSLPSFKMGFHSLLSGKAAFLRSIRRAPDDKVINLNVQDMVTAHDTEDKHLLEKLVKYITHESIKVALAWVYGFNSLMILEWLKEYDNECSLLSSVVKDIEFVADNQRCRDGNDHEMPQHATVAKPMDRADTVIITGAFQMGFNWADEIAEEESRQSSSLGENPATPYISRAGTGTRHGGSVSPTGSEKSSASQETSITHPPDANPRPDVTCSQLQRAFSLLGAAILLDMTDLAHVCTQHLTMAVTTLPGVDQTILMLSELLGVHASTHMPARRGYYTKELGNILLQNALPLAARELDLAVLRSCDGAEQENENRQHESSEQQRSEDAVRNLLLRLPHHLFTRLAKWKCISDGENSPNIGKRYEVIKTAVDERNMVRGAKGSKEHKWSGRCCGDCGEDGSLDESRLRERALVEFVWGEDAVRVPLVFGDLAFPMGRARIVVEAKYVGTLPVSLMNVPFTTLDWELDH